MKRGRDGAIRVDTEFGTRARALAALRCLVCPVVYRHISSHPTKSLLLLLAKLHRDQLTDGPAAGNE